MLSRIYRTESEIRKRQINTLKIFNDNVTEVQENSEYKVTFNSGRNELNLLVSLTPEFPNEKPILKISPSVSHPWVNGDGEITSAPGLLNFTVHSDLGRVVQAIIREFERTPPPLASDHSTTSITSPTNPILESDSVGRASPSYHLSFMGRQTFSPPPLSTNTSTTQSVAFPELNTLSLEELQYLSESTDRQEEFIDNLPQMKEMNKTVDDLILQVEELAISNLTKRERLDDLKKAIDERIEEVTKLAFETERLNATYQTLSDNYAPRNIQEQLKLAANKEDRKSEKIAESFLNGELEVDKFLSIYLQSRMLSHTRRTKEEKLSQQLDRLEKAGF